jgi:hypothetical protein
MKTLRTLTLAAGAAVAMIGCGGSNNGTLPSLYVGSWTGTWSSPTANDGGSITMVVVDDGSISGTIGRTGGVSATLGGVINNTGHFTATTTSFSNGGAFLMNGAVVLNNGALFGSFTYGYLGESYSGSFTTTSQSSGTAGSTGG